MKTFILLVTSLLAIAPLAAQAGDVYANDMKFVVGGAISSDQSNFDDVFNDDAGIAASGIRFEDSDADVGENIYFGIRFNPYITARLGYRNFGDFDGDVSSGGVKIGKAEVEADGIYLAADGMYPFTDRFSLGGTIGLQNWNGDFKFSGPGGSSSDSEDARDFFYGVRAAYRFTATTSLIASYDFYRFDVDDISKDIEYDALAVGLEVAF